ncbi:8-hydroxygeraniol dehydrogenase-like [Coffea eugenioides]|uniref:8-hydroxygeraniol dehydrogenase-like n=1 Tax=Coffea eugenioides TaxID=49369 RepID=UPI000F60D8B6|nr:8-hydroxygeraniol dehydrogenase-like [Coffea eugenioides]
MAGKNEVRTYGLAARDTSGVFSPVEFARRATGEEDVRFKVLYCGICHADLHSAKDDFGHTSYPVVPGHEIVGEVTEVGSKVTNFKIGDKVGVGCFVGSCRSCEQCSNDLEPYCPKRVMTYGSIDEDGTRTRGGYSNEMVVKEHFAIRWPENLPLDGGAPLLCAGCTLYSPLMYYGLSKPGTHLGIVGLGGLGHVGVKFAQAMGLKVTVISSSNRKKAEAVDRLGVDSFLVSTDPEQMQTAMGTLDGIIDTVSAFHPVMPLISLLKPHGKLIVVGAPNKPLEVEIIPLLTGRKMIGSSAAAGIKETQEMIDFAAKHNITADVEVIPANYVNKAMERLEKGDVRYRFVIDIGNTLAAAPST